MKTKTTITVETWKYESVKTQPAMRARAFCNFCRRDAEIFSLHETALQLKVTEREVVRRVETGMIHLINAGSRLVMICGESLVVGKFDTKGER